MRKDYDAWIVEQRGNPEPFIIGGQEFTPRAKLPWIRFGRLIMSMDDEEADETAKLKEFYSLVLKRADRQRFLDLLSDEEEDDDAVIDPMQIHELTKDLMAMYTAKASASADSLNSGLATIGDRSNVVSLTPHKLTG